MTAPVAHVHGQGCWRHNDRCALESAKIALEIHEAHRSEVRTRDLLAVMRMAIRDHAEQPCPEGHECFAVHQARTFLAEA